MTLNLKEVGTLNVLGLPSPDSAFFAVFTASFDAFGVISGTQCSPRFSIEKVPHHDDG
jgi:hypothetical protein